MADQTPQQIAQLVAEVLGLGPSHSLGPDTLLTCDPRAVLARHDVAHVDSLDRQAIAAAFDQHFAIQTPDDDVAAWTTLADIAATAARLRATGAAD